jgi:hypothetical protein
MKWYTTILNISPRVYRSTVWTEIILGEQPSDLPAQLIDQSAHTTTLAEQYCEQIHTCTRGQTLTHTFAQWSFGGGDGALDARNWILGRQTLNVYLLPIPISIMKTYDVFKNIYCNKMKCIHPFSTHDFKAFTRIV